eukprot:3385910-Alexandrium_andersonii.AAC.1
MDRHRSRAEVQTVGRVRLGPPAVWSVQIGRPSNAILRLSCFVGLGAAAWEDASVATHDPSMQRFLRRGHPQSILAQWCSLVGWARETSGMASSPAHWPPLLVEALGEI